MPLRVVDARPDWVETWGQPLILVRPDGYVAWAGDGVGAEEAADLFSRAIGGASAPSVS